MFPVGNIYLERGAGRRSGSRVERAGRGLKERVIIKGTGHFSGNFYYSLKLTT